MRCIFLLRGSLRRHRDVEEAIDDIEEPFVIVSTLRSQSMIPPTGVLLARSYEGGPSCKEQDLDVVIQPARI